MTSLDIQRVDTSNVTDMGGMFAHCIPLAILDLSGWDTSSVTNMEGMFHSCSSLSYLDLSGWDTSSVTGMGDMFLDCYSLTEIKVGDSYQIRSADMFPDATADSGWWSTSNSCWYTKDEVTSSRSGVADTYLNQERRQIASGAWGTCRWVVDSDGALTVHAGHGADTEYNCPWGDYDVCRAITSATFETGVVLPADCSALFFGCSGIVSMDLSGVDAVNVTNMDDIFYECSSLESLDLSGWDTSSVTNMEGLFDSCNSLAFLDLSGWDTTSVTKTAYMFLGPISLAEFRVGDGYQIKSNDMFPYTRVNSGWWPTADSRWYSKDDIVASRSGVADTYLNHGPEPDLSRDGWVTLSSGAKGYARGGSLVTGWLTLESQEYWFDADGAAAEGWAEGGGQTYYFRPGECRMAKGWTTIDGAKLLFRSDGRLADGWVTLNGASYYADDGVSRTGWQELAEGRRYFRPAPDYRMATGWATVDGAKYQFDELGRVVG